MTSLPETSKLDHSHLQRTLRHTRSLKEIGMERFNERVSGYIARLERLKKNMDSIFLDIDANPIRDLGAAGDIREDLTRLSDKYWSLSNDYISFLRRFRTASSVQYIDEHTATMIPLQEKVKDIIQRLTLINKPSGKVQGSYIDVASETSKGSRLSHGSRSSSKLTTIIAEHSAQLEAAKIRMKYAKEESDLIEQEAAVVARKNALKAKRDYDIAKSSLTAVKEAINIGSLCDNPVSAEEPTCDSLNNRKEHADVLSSLNPRAAVFHPCQNNSVNIQSQELAKFMVKKDLLTSRLATFDDQPTHYAYWKVSFTNVMEELDASPMEHLDLLIKSLSPSSRKQAVNIRSANGHDLENAVKLIWERLDDRYGSPEIIESALKQRIQKFPRLTDANREELFDLSDLVAEIESVKRNGKFSTTFAYFDSSSGVNLIVDKLPYRIQEKWANEANRYKQTNRVSYPPLSVFSSFLHNIARLRNDPSFIFERPTHQRFNPGKQSQGQSANSSFRKTNESAHVSVRKTDVNQNENNKILCPIHNTGHSLNMCRAFRSQPFTERLKFVKEKGFCFKCCGPVKHQRKKCRETVKCDICKSGDHPSALHPDNLPSTSAPTSSHEGEEHKTEVKSACTEICNTKTNTSKSCAKILLVNVYPRNQKHLIRKVYCMLDDQSNRSLVTSDLLRAFGNNSAEKEYVMSSCAGKFVTSGRRATGYVVESLDGTFSLNLPEVIECNDIPNSHDEIPSPTIAEAYPHLRDIAPLIPPVDNRINVELLIGRDCISAHHVLNHRIGTNGLPYAQQLNLGWVIIGSVCLGKVHEPEYITVNKVNILTSGRPTLFDSCDSQIHVKEVYSDIFKREPGDEKQGLSIDDKKFLRIMDSGFHRNSNGFWEAPLPFRDGMQPLPNNQTVALRRAKSCDLNLKSNPVKQRQVLEFMDKLLLNKHAEVAPELPLTMERWYLPMFSVYHPKKPDNMRVVFDASAKFKDISLNSVLLQGPDMCNSLLGVLLRFRKEKVAITMDVEQMFHNFKVPEDHRRFLRFLWHQNNDINLPLVDFQMTVHVFGNSASPAVATYGLRKAVEGSDADVRDLVCNNFYVDDGLLSVQSEEQAVDLVLRTKESLQIGGNIRLHKFASNCRRVLDSFCQSDLAKTLKDLDLGTSDLPMQRSLGLLWDTETDEFTFKVTPGDKPYTRRGLLSVINAVYDPLGFVQPVLIRGKLLLREMRSVTTDMDWDDPLPESLHDKWSSWVDSLSHLEGLRIPRMCGSISFAGANQRRVLVYADASKDVIAAVAYMKLQDEETTSTRFLLGKAKVAPQHGHTIPRLELCAAVLATEIAETVSDHLCIPKEEFQFFSDSQVVLGYISNESRRFFIYVGNRVGRIRSFSKPSQWSFVQSEFNPADVATRAMEAEKLQFSSWLKGPSEYGEDTSTTQSYELVDPDCDIELRPVVSCAKIDHLNTKTTNLNGGTIPESSKAFSDRFSHVSSWRRLVRVIGWIKILAKRIRRDNIDPYLLNDPEFLEECERSVIGSVQHDTYREELKCIRDHKGLPKSSSISQLCPSIDKHGVLHVGGRLNKVHDDILDVKLRNPIILPKNNHVSYLIVRHFHEHICHQGRHLTEGAVRSSGNWIVGCKRMVSSIISKCVMCRKLRGPLGWQHMADLPEDTCKPSPPFSYVGVDTFGPWFVKFRRTRGGCANQKRWALLFTCLVTRAIHIEVIEELTSSAFINALRRLISIRGPILQFRSDRGTNFVGATEDLSIDAKFIEDETIASFLSNARIKWIFNPPHTPHMGGAWERLIGIAKRILNAMLLQHQPKDLTHEVLTTFLFEVCAIVNNRPLTCVSNDPESPVVLTPSMLLTMKPSGEIGSFPPFSTKEALRSTWKHVQTLAEEFWRKWRSEYLHGLQVRRKWQDETVNLKPGDLVLLKDGETSRNYWPTGIIERTFPSSDGIVRKAEVAIVKHGKRLLYVRPITELVTILEA